MEGNDFEESDNNMQESDNNMQESDDNIQESNDNMQKSFNDALIASITKCLLLFSFLNKLLVNRVLHERKYQLQES